MANRIKRIVTPAPEAGLRPAGEPARWYERQWYQTNRVFDLCDIRFL